VPAACIIRQANNSDSSDYRQPPCHVCTSARPPVCDFLPDQDTKLSFTCRHVISVQRMHYIDWSLPFPLNRTEWRRWEAASPPRIHLPTEQMVTPSAQRVADRLWPCYSLLCHRAPPSVYASAVDLWVRPGILYGGRMSFGRFASPWREDQIALGHTDGVQEGPRFGLCTSSA
jgi:hypothetical protein